MNTLLAFLLVFIGPPSFSQDKAVDSYVKYTPNKKQWTQPIRYQADFNGGRLFVEQAQLTYVFYESGIFEKLHIHNKPSVNENGHLIKLHALKVKFENANAQPALEHQDPFPGYTNYFLGNDQNHWASEVSSFHSVTYHQLYKDIDLKLYSQNNNVKYDYILQAGANPASIRMSYEGADKIYLENDQLVIMTSVGKIIEQKPYAFQWINSRKVEVPCRFLLEGRKVAFSFPKGYNTNLPLIIDPTLIFATFSGSTVDNWGMTATYDNLTNTYSAGIAFGIGYPTTAGAYQTFFAGGGTGGGNPQFAVDIVLSKYNPTGSTMLYSTYLGGSDNELPQSLIIDNNNELLLYGRTYSPNFPFTTNAYDSTYNGNADIVVCKFNATGTKLVASTFFGGSADDGVNMYSVETQLGSLKYNYSDDARGEIMVNKNNEVLIAASTHSSNFPISPKAIQKTFGGGTQDGCAFSLNSTLTALNWSTYLGGSANDAAYAIALNSKQEAYITGGTESSNFPSTSGVLHPTYQGGSADGFIIHLNVAADTLKQGTFIGTAGYDQSYFVQIDRADDIYIYGQSEGGYPVTSGVYSNANSGQFIHKLDDKLSTTQFSTVFGTGSGVPDISPCAFLVDKCGNIYISGWGGDLYGYNRPKSTTYGMPVTPGAYQTKTDGSDFYFMALKKEATGLWYATFFGGPSTKEHVDGGTSRFSKDGVIYQSVCGGCGGQSDMPTTPGVWSNINKSTNCNNAVIKFKFDLINTVAQFTPSVYPQIGCAPLNVHFSNASLNGISYEWWFGDGGKSNDTDPWHTYNAPGKYKITLIVTNLLSCNIKDTAYGVMEVLPPLPYKPVSNQKICSGDSVQLNGNGGTFYQWTPTTGLSNGNIANPYAKPSSTTNYVLKVSDTICNVFDTVTVSVFQNRTFINATDSVKICAYENRTFDAGSGYLSYQWNTGQQTQTITVSKSGTYYVNTVDSNNCKGQDTVKMEVLPPVVASVSNDTILCIGQTAQLHASGGDHYTWTPTTGLNNSSIQDPFSSPTKNTVYIVTVHQGLCTASDTLRVWVKPTPQIDIIESDILLDPLEGIQLHTKGDTTIVWTPPDYLSCTNCPNPFVKPEVSGLYYVTVYAANGCWAKDSVNISIKETFYVPNSFSPNGDGLNELFRPYFTEIKELHVMIFDRWGLLLYQWNTLDGAWDGRYLGNFVQEDVYVWVANAVSNRNTKIERQGTVTIIK